MPARGESAPMEAAPALAVEAVSGNLCHAMSCYSRSSYAGELTELSNSFLLVCSGVDYAVFNAALILRPFRDGMRQWNALLHQASRHFALRHLSWSFWLYNDLLPADDLPAARAALQRLGLRLIADHQGMFAPAIVPPSRELPSLKYRRVSDPRSRADFSSLVSGVFSVPASVISHVYGGEPFWEGDYVAWVGYEQNSPVTTMATCSTASAVGVYSVATSPQYRGRGYGEAVTRHGLESAFRASGLSRSILQSTPDGLALYRRMGYYPAGSVSVFISS
jgi:ribosomal protein S18 acetylase RimI-like enzyme